MRVRVASLAALVLAGGLAAVAAANCASPTQIIVDVRVDSSLCSGINTGIAIGAPSTIENAALTVYQAGCRAAGGSGQSQVGALTITPSDADDGEVTLKIIAAVGERANPDACGREDNETGKADWSSCILARRTARFVPGETVTLTVRLTSDCVGQYCGAVNECSSGQCVRPEQVQTDGGVLDATVIEVDSGPDPVTDAGADACAIDCIGPKTECDAPQKKCKITCGGSRPEDRCSSQTRCSGDFDCLVVCGGAGVNVDRACTGVSCTTSKTCEFDCTGSGNDHCRDIDCRGQSCKVSCSNTDSTCRDVAMDAGTNTISCEPTDRGNPTCKNIVCNGDCTRTCGDAGLGCAAGDQSRCNGDTGDCEKFEDAGPDAGPGKP